MTLPPTLTHAQELLAAGRWRDARPLLERIAEAPGCDPAIVRKLAEIEILEGDAERAMARLERLGPDAEADFLLARAEERLGRTAAARDRLLKLRSRLPAPSAVLELALAHLHRALGESRASEAALAAAMRLEPDFADSASWLRLAQARTREGNAAAALDSLAHAVAARPRDALTWTSIGHLYGEHMRYSDADAAFAQAAELDPGSPDIEPLRAVVKQELGDDAGALAALARAARRAPDDPRVAFAERLYLPQAYESADAVRHWRKRFVDGLASLARDRERWTERAAEAFRIDRGNFFLAYHGEDDRELQQRYSALLGELAARAAPGLVEPLARTYDGKRRLRVGFLGNMFRESTAGRYFERWITGLDAARFERFVYHTAPVADDFTRRVAAAADVFFDERVDNRRMAERVRGDELDVLVYPEVGMSSMTYVLATLRLAPVQCAGWGHPVTTGSAAIDHYFTCGEMEPPDAAGHYSEHLVPLPGIGVEYAMPEPPAALPRARLGLADDAHLYVCAQSLFKVHPEMDDVFARILAADAKAVLVFFQAPSRAVTDLVASRLQRSIAAHGVAPRGQVKFLPRLAGPYFRGALAAADVVLDTFRWSGGNTSIDAFAAATPVVTLEGRFMRGRQTAAMLRMMDLAELVAGGPDAYAATAIAVAGDGERRAALRRAIAERREILFGRRDCLDAFQDALLAVARGPR